MTRILVDSRRVLFHIVNLSTFLKSSLSSVSAFILIIVYQEKDKKINKKGGKKGNFLVKQVLSVLIPKGKKNNYEIGVPLIKKISQNVSDAWNTHNLL